MLRGPGRAGKLDSLGSRLLDRVAGRRVLCAQGFAKPVTQIHQDRDLLRYRCRYSITGTSLFGTAAGIGTSAGISHLPVNRTRPPRAACIQLCCIHKIVMLAGGYKAVSLKRECSTTYLTGTYLATQTELHVLLTTSLPRVFRRREEFGLAHGHMCLLWILR